MEKEAKSDVGGLITTRPLVVMTGGALLPYLAGSALLMGLRTTDVLGRIYVDPELFFQWIPWVQTMAAFLVLLWALWMIHKDKLAWGEVGFSSDNWVVDIIWGLGGGAVLWFLLDLTYYSVRFLPQTPLTNFPVTFSALPALVFIVVSSFSGELTYRGYGLGRIARRSGILWALLVTSLLTAATAWIGGWQGVIVWLMMGLALGLMVILRRGSILPGFLARVIATTLLWGLGSPLILLGVF